MLVQGRHAERRDVVDRATEAAIDRHAVVGRVAGADAAGVVLCRLQGVELDDAGGGVATEQRTLRAAQHFHLVHVIDRVGLQHHVFQHHVVLDDRHRLRGTQVEVDVAQAADVEAREGTTVGRFDVQAGHARGQEADVIAGRAEHIQLLTLDRRDRDRHVLGVLDAALCGDLQGVEGNRILGSGGFLGSCYQRQQGGKSGNEGTRDRKSATGSAGRGHGGRLCLEGW
ncbi:hypothetical protein G6F24_015163 [Rhizopus arrhizus]|nr:hypothetical protein G6F24_015163 [Rhizopus arrhizus]